MPIDLDQSDGTPSCLQTRAFARPDVNAVLRWDVLSPHVSAASKYAPYLVHVLSYVEGQSVRFLGVDLQTGKDIREEIPHELNLGLPAVVWSGLPSTLRGYRKQATPYAILFLTDGYERIRQLSPARGKGRFPIRGSNHKLLELLKQFSKHTAGETKQAFDEAFSEYL